MKLLKTKDYEIYTFLDNLDLAKENSKFIQNFLENFDSLNLNYSNRNKLEDEINYPIFGEKGKEIYFEVNEDQKNEILEVLKKTLIELKNFTNKKTNVFVLPTFDPFVKNEMGGSIGHCFVNNFIFIFLNPVTDFKKNLKETLAHEFAHSVSPYYLKEEVKLGTCLVSEGLAEHFRESIFGGEVAPFSKALNENEIKEYFEELKSKLDSTEEELYLDVFFGSKKYPNWTGYTLGYYLVEKYLKDKQNIDWNVLLRKNPEEILKEVL